MRLIILIALGFGGFHVLGEMDDPNSEIGQAAHELIHELRTAAESSGGGAWDLDYASTAASRPNTMDYAARGGSSVGSAPDPWPQFGRTNSLEKAYKAYRETYDHYQYFLSNYGPNNSRTQESRQEYLNAKYHYDALANRAHR